MPKDQADAYDMQMIRQEAADEEWHKLMDKVMNSELVSASIVFYGPDGKAFKEYEYGTLQDLKNDLPTLPEQIDQELSDYAYDRNIHFEELL